MDDGARAVEAYYTVGDLGPAILRALDESGKDARKLTPEDLEVVDSFHMRGHEATRELAEAAGLSSEDRVLDVGCGLGGSARYLTAEYGCEVLGIDAVDEFCRVARVLSARTALDRNTNFQRGSALDLPVEEDESFDVVWMEHVQVNVEEKERLYAEVDRVLDPEGRLAFHEIFQGDGGEVVLPVPWADEPELSFLCTPDEISGLLTAAGFREVTSKDVTEAAVTWFREVAEDGAGDSDGPPPLGLHLLMGARSPEKMANQLRNLEERRVVAIQAVWEKEG